MSMVRPVRGVRRRAVTLTELLVAITISLVFMTSVVAAYIQISRAADISESRVQAHTRARNAIDRILREVRLVQNDPSLGNNQVFELTTNPLTRGDGIDNDRDGLVDEEIVDGFDNDGDWTISSDNHASLLFTGDRGDYVGVADLGDFNVDEDTVFSRDTLRFRIPADAGMGSPALEIRYFVGAFDGFNDVLLREEISAPGTASELTTLEPVIFDIMSFDVLAWNPNDNVTSPATPQAPYWSEEFDAEDIRNAAPPTQPIGAPLGTPPFQFPAAVYVRVTVNAESRMLADIPAWPLGSEPIQTVTLESLATLDAVISDPRYEMFVREQVKP